MFLGHRRHSREERNGFVKEISSSKKVVFDYMNFFFFGGGGIFFALIKPFHETTTTVYARSAFYPSLRFTLSLQSALYTQSAFYPWSAVRSLQSTVRSLRFTLTAKKGWEIFYFKSKKGAYFHIHIIKWLGLHHTSCDGGFYYDSCCSLYFLASK